jgi:hypothetical protein
MEWNDESEIVEEDIRNSPGKEACNISTVDFNLKTKIPWTYP